MPLAAVYATHSATVILRDLNGVVFQRFTLDNIAEFSDHEIWTDSMTVERYIKAMANAFRFQTDDVTSRKHSHCDELLILANQDCYIAIKRMVNHADIHGYARKCRVVPALAARLSFVTQKVAEILETCGEGTFFAIVSLHDDGYEVFRLQVVKDHNYLLHESNFYNTFEECVNAHRQLLDRGMIERSFVLGKNGKGVEQRSERFAPGFFVPYEDFELMLYDGGLSKLESSYAGRNEVLDFAPQVLIRYFGKTRMKMDQKLFGPNVFAVSQKPDGLIRGFGICYAPEICYINRFLSRRAAKVILPFQECDYARISADIRKHGIMVIHANAYDPSIFEYCDMSDDAVFLNATVDYEKFATRFIPEDVARNMPKYIFDNFNVPVKSPSLVFTLKMVGDNEFISVTWGDGEGIAPCKDVSGKTSTPMFISFAGGNPFVGDLAVSSMVFDESSVLHDISKVIGLKYEDVEVAKNWKFSLTSIGGAPCYKYELDETPVIMTPEYVLSAIFKIMWKNVESKAKSMYSPYTILKVGRGMFTQQQLYHVLIAAGMAELDVQRIDII